MYAGLSFELFMSLPTEIRLEIWRFSCHARAVEIWYDEELDIALSNTAAPAVLFACRESRRESLKIYTKFFGTWTHEPSIYFDPQRDTLYLPRPERLGYDEMSRAFSHYVYGTAEVLNLALDYVSPAIRKPWETYNKYAMMLSFPQVKEVLLVVDPPAHSEAGEDRELRSLEDPMDDTNFMSRILAEVMESFVYELGVDFKTAHDQDIRIPSLVLKAKDSLNRFHVDRYRLEHS